jgi:hypothetical protein
MRSLVVLRITIQAGVDHKAHLIPAIGSQDLTPSWSLL